MTKNKNFYWIILVLFLLFGLLYTFTGSRLGVRLSCTTKDVLACDTVPPPLLAISPQTVCNGYIEISTNSITLCKGPFKSPMKEYVYPCPELKNYRGQNITVKLTVDNNGQTVKSIVC